MANAPALLFASTEQLNMLKVAKEVYFDATFKVVLGIYYQLLRVFAACGDTSDAVKSACFNHLNVWLWCHAGILASVAGTLSHPCPICRTPIRMVLCLYG